MENISDMVQRLHGAPVCCSTPRSTPKSRSRKRLQRDIDSEER